MIEKGSAMFILLFLFWLMMMGSITTEIVIFGLLISAAIYPWHGTRRCSCS